MAESDLEKNADFTQIYNKHHGEEDPRVAAQRYLNIFRQLHIFTAHKRQEFDNLLLNLPLSIKKEFSHLPGGSVLHEYLNDLEEKAGVEISAADDIVDKSAKSKSEAPTSANLSHDISQAKILAKALAEAQARIPVQAGSQLAADDVKRLTDDLNRKFEAMRHDFEKSFSERHLKNIDPTIIDDLKASLEAKIQSPTAAVCDVKIPEVLTVSPSSDFKDALKEMVDKCLVTYQQSQKQNTLDLSKIFGASQEKLAQIIHMQQEKKDSGKEIADALSLVLDKNAEANRQANAELVNALKVLNMTRVSENGKSSVNIEALIDALVEKQTMVFKDFSQRQSDVLSHVIANVLKESNSSSIELFSQALDSFQQESSKILKMQASLQKALLINSKSLKSLAESNVNPTSSETADNPKPENLSTLVDDLLDIDPAATKKKKKKKKKKKGEASNIEASQTEFDHIYPSGKISLDHENASLADNDYSSLSGETSYQEHPSSKAVSDQEWEYVDDNGHPVSDQEWEYVDDDGNPVSDQEWEYVDDDGNPVSDQEWEYVDDDGNPVSDQEWEYVDDDGNPVSDQEWEYVDDDGNPVSNQASSLLTSEPNEKFISESLEPASEPINQENETTEITDTASFLASPVTENKQDSLSDSDMAQKFTDQFNQKIELPEENSLISSDSNFIPDIKIAGSEDSSRDDPYLSNPS